MAEINGGRRADDDLSDEDLLSQLTEDDLKALEVEMDPENDLLPARERQANQTTKKPTGEYDRSKLLEHMKTEALESKVGANYIPFENKKRGKSYQAKPKPEEKKAILSDDLSDVLNDATEDELMELAAVLGIHGLLNQRQSEEAENDKVWQSLKGSGLKKYKPGVVGSKKYKQYSDPNAVNELDLEEAMEKLTDNDESLTELNLNNHKDVTEETLEKIANNLQNNQHLINLYLANCKVGDNIIKVMCESLKNNKQLKSLNLESNLITTEGVEEIMQMLTINNTLQELKLANQPTKFGYGLETKLANMLEKNTSLLRFGFSFSARGPRHAANKYIMRNNDAERVARNEAKKISQSSSIDE